MELVRPVGREHRDAFAPEATGDEAEEVASRAVGPMEVLRDQNHRSPLTQALEQDQESIEQPGLRPFRWHIRKGSAPCLVQELGYEPGEFTSRRIHDLLEEGSILGSPPSAERLGDGGERQPLAGSKAGAAAFEDQVPAIARIARDLRQESALADARLAADEDHHRRSVLRAAERLLEGRHLSASTDQDRTR